MTPSTTHMSRRTLFAGASTVGAVAAVTSLLPSLKGAPEPVAQAPKPAPERGGGYALSAHVKQYYKTTLV